MKIINTIKSNIEAKFISAMRKHNDEIVLDIHNSGKYKGNSVFVFIPDRAPDGKISFTRTSNIITYTMTGGISSIFAAKELDSKVWSDIGLNPITFEGQVYRFGYGDLYPKLLWDSNVSYSYFSNVPEKMVFPFSFKKNFGRTLKAI